MSYLQVGIVGAGDITGLVHLPVLKNYGDVHVEWIADLDAQRVCALGRVFEVDRQIVLQREKEIQLPPCDIVLLATPVYARRTYLEYFCARGNAILTEKPFAVSADEHQSFLRLCVNNHIHCGYMRRTYATVRALRRMVRESWFGQLRSIRYSEGGRVSRTTAASKTLDMSYKNGGGVLRDLGCHGIDLMLYVTGASRFSVQGSKIEWDQETDRQIVSDFTLSGMDYIKKNECQVEFSVSWLSEQSNQMIFEFDHASLRAGIRPEAELEIASPLHKDIWTRLSLDIIGARSSYQAFFLEWQDIVCALRNGPTGELSAASSLLTTRIVDDMYRLGGGQ